MNVNDLVPDFTINLSDGRETSLYYLLNKGPVILNFIMGTWCPVCTSHLSKVRSWQNKLNKNITMLIITSETSDNIIKYQNENKTSYLFASDHDLKIINMFNLRLMLMDIAKPATYLIDSDKHIKISFNKMRSKKNTHKLLTKVCETCDNSPT